MPNIAVGSSSSAPATDQYNVTWYSTTPDIGAVTYRNVQNILPTYQPTERNASTITIAPGSTSQSIELYLGATGLIQRPHLVSQLATTAHAQHLSLSLW